MKLFMLTANVPLFFNNIAAAVFPILNISDWIFLTLHFTWQNLKTWPFHPRKEFSLLVYLQAVTLTIPCLLIWCWNIPFQRLYFFKLGQSKARLIMLHGVWNLRNRILHTIIIHSKSVDHSNLWNVVKNYQRALFFDYTERKVILLWFIYVIIPCVYGDIKGGSRADATSKMEHFLTIVKGWKPYTIITKRPILDDAAPLYPPLGMNTKSWRWRFVFKMWR